MPPTTTGLQQSSYWSDPTFRWASTTLQNAYQKALGRAPSDQEVLSQLTGAGTFGQPKTDVQHVSNVIASLYESDEAKAGKNILSGAKKPIPAPIPTGGGGSSGGGGGVSSSSGGGGGGSYSNGIITGGPGVFASGGGALQQVGQDPLSAAITSGLMGILRSGGTPAGQEMLSTLKDFYTGGGPPVGGDIGQATQSAVKAILAGNGPPVGGDVGAWFTPILQSIISGTGQAPQTQTTTTATPTTPAPTTPAPTTPTTPAQPSPGYKLAPTTPDPFAAIGGGVWTGDGWVPKDHPLARAAQAQQPVTQASVEAEAKNQPSNAPMAATFQPGVSQETIARHSAGGGQAQPTTSTPTSPDPFAAIGGGVWTGTGWVPKDHPLAETAQQTTPQTTTTAPAPTPTTPAPTQTPAATTTTQTPTTTSIAQSLTGPVGGDLGKTLAQDVQQILSGQGPALGGQIGDEFSKLLLSMAKGEGPPVGGEVGKTLAETVTQLLQNAGNYNTERQNQRFETIREGIDRARSASLAEGQSALAARGLASVPGAPQGSEAGLIRRIEERLAPIFATETRNALIQESELADQRFLAAMSQASNLAGLSEQRLGNLIPALSQYTSDFEARRQAAQQLGVQLAGLSEQRWVAAVQSINQLVQQYEQRLQTGIQAGVDLSGQYESRIQTALASAAGLAANEAQAFVDALEAGTERQEVLANIALGTLDRNIMWNRFLAEFNMDRQVTAELLRSGRISDVNNLINQFLSFTNIVRGGQVGEGES